MEKQPQTPSAAPSMSGRPGRYRLCLYVAGGTMKSERAILATRALCNRFVPQRYELRVVDVFQYPEQAIRHRLQCVPALVREDLDPCRHLAGNLDSAERLRELLELDPGELPA